MGPRRVARFTGNERLSGSGRATRRVRSDDGHFRLCRHVTHFRPYAVNLQRW